MIELGSVRADEKPVAADPAIANGTYPWPVWTPAIPAVPRSTTGVTYYVDGKDGNDANDGKSLAKAFATIARSVSLVAAGDTVLIRGGLYREGINLINARRGTEGKPITFGSLGDGEVILDGSAKVTGWTLQEGTVWKAPVTFTPICVVVNEVPLKQVTQGQGRSTAPQVGRSGVTSGSGKWFFDAGEKAIYADMGTRVDPNTADVIVPNNVPDQKHVHFYGGEYFTLDGLTVRGCGAGGIWGQGSHIIVNRCNIKFNGKAAVNFQGKGSDNAVFLSHAYHNVLVNWPRGNNGFAESGGGWSGGLGWATQMRPVARGNIVHQNGGEGIISYGTNKGFESGHALFEQNVIYDNWSVNLYFDNQAHCVARNNFIFNHPPNPADWLYSGDKYPYNQLGKFTVGLMLADEEGSSDATGDYANLDHTQVYNNIIAGCRIGIRDYSEGNAHAIKFHGLKNTLIANNTIILPPENIPNTEIMGIFLQDNTTPSGINRNVNTVIKNNLIYGDNENALVWSAPVGAHTGITFDSNAYFSEATKPFRVGFNRRMNVDFAGWKATVEGADRQSLFQDPQLVNVGRSRTAGAGVYDYKAADLKPSSPLREAGTPLSEFSTNFVGRDRIGAKWSIGAF